VWAAQLQKDAIDAILVYLMHCIVHDAWLICIDTTRFIVFR
jgi:hypothetical protein